MLSRILYGIPNGYSSLSADQVRTLRLAIGITACFISAIAIKWPLAYISPLLLCCILGSRKKPLTLKDGVALLALIFLAFVPFVLMGLIIPRWPLISALLLIVGFYYIFYLKALSKLPDIAVILLLVGITLLPLLALTHPELSLSVSLGFLFSAFIAVLAAWVSFFLMPDPKTATYEQKANANSHRQKHEAQIRALTSTLAIAPLALCFYAFNFVHSVLVFVFVAILMQNPEVGTNLKAGAGLLLGNLLGGVLAYFIFFFIKAAPSLPFFSFLLLFSLLLLGSRIFSEHKRAALYGASLPTVILLLSSVTSSAGGDFEEKFVSRMVQLFCATSYVVLSLIVLKGLFQKKALAYLSKFDPA